MKVSRVQVKRNAKDIVTLSDGDINESQRAVELLKLMKLATAIMCDEHSDIAIKDPDPSKHDS